MVATQDTAPRLAGLDGELLGPADPRYDHAREVFNAMVDRRPALIAQCRSRADVVRALRHARERSLEVAVRGGGHGVAGRAVTDGGLVLDLRLLRDVVVDPAARTATVAGGATMADLDRATEPHGLATTGGRVSTTGVTGLTLGGGNGWLDRCFGLASDNLLAADVVLADGTVVHTSETEHSDLFWALHGGGGNFGVVLSLTLRLHPLRTVTAAKLLWPGDAGPAVVRAFRDLMSEAPDELGGACCYLTAPPVEIVPPALAGRLSCAVVLCDAGSGGHARAAVGALRELGPAAELLTELPYADWQCANEDPPGYRNHWSSDHLDAFPDEAVDLFCASGAATPVPSPSVQALLRQGGALARGPSDHPLPWRHAPWHVARFAMWDDPRDDERAASWARRLTGDLSAWSSGHHYLAFTGDEGRDRTVAGYGRENLTRLRAVKRRYDPDNVFHLNHNIVPA